MGGVRPELRTGRAVSQAPARPSRPPARRGGRRTPRRGDGPRPRASVLADRAVSDRVLGRPPGADLRRPLAGRHESARDAHGVLAEARGARRDARRPRDRGAHRQPLLRGLLARPAGRNDQPARLRARPRPRGDRGGGGGMRPHAGEPGDARRRRLACRGARGQRARSGGGAGDERLYDERLLAGAFRESHSDARLPDGEHAARRTRARQHPARRAALDRHPAPLLGRAAPRRRTDSRVGRWSRVRHGGRSEL